MSNSDHTKWLLASRPLQRPFRRLTQILQPDPSLSSTLWTLLLLILRLE